MRERTKRNLPEMSDKDIQHLQVDPSIQHARQFYISSVCAIYEAVLKQRSSGTLLCVALKTGGRINRANEDSATRQPEVTAHRDVGFDAGSSKSGRLA